jgi:hypothetical protein
MKLSSKNLLAKYYSWIYGELPKDLCSFFWGSLFAIVFILIYIPGRIFNHDGASRFWAGLGSWLVYFAMLSVGCRIFTSWHGVKEEDTLAFMTHLPWFMIWVVMPLITALIVSLFVLVLVGFVGCVMKIEEIDKPNIAIIQNTKDWIGAIRGKYCTKIEWINSRK